MYSSGMSAWSVYIVRCKDGSLHFFGVRSGNGNHA